MTNNEIIQYYDYLMRLAESKCNSQADAEDLVGDTMLAAFTYTYKGGTIKTKYGSKDEYLNCIQVYSRANICS